jgi:hypothetical protein
MNVREKLQRTIGYGVIISAFPGTETYVVRSGKPDIMSTIFLS